MRMACYNKMAKVCEGSGVVAKVSTNVSIDAETKARAQELLADLGLDLSTAVNIFLRQMVYENAIPFEIKRASSPPSASVSPEGNGDRGER